MIDRLVGADRMKEVVLSSVFWQQCFLWNPRFLVLVLPYEFHWIFKLLRIFWNSTALLQRCFNLSFPLLCVWIGSSWPHSRYDISGVHSNLREFSFDNLRFLVTDDIEQNGMISCLLRHHSLRRNVCWCRISYGRFFFFLILNSLGIWNESHLHRRNRHKSYMTSIISTTLTILSTQTVFRDWVGAQWSITLLTR